MELENILEKIIAHKRKEVAAAKAILPTEQILRNENMNRPVLSLKSSLLEENRTGIIAEFKRKSPSKGIINETADVTEIAAGYTKFGASGLSILTDETFFGGTAVDLKKARINGIPILRKDFIIDEYQIAEAKLMGADVILLIAACLGTEEVSRLASFAKKLQMEVLLEIHSDNELEHICDDTELIGVNNRDLKTFTVDISRSLELAKKIPAGKIKIAESGIHNVETICIFKNAGFKGFLIGENFMKQPDPAIAFAHFVQQLKSASH